MIVTDIYVDDRALNDLDSALRVKVSAATPLAARSIQIPPAVRKFGVEFALLTYSNQVNNHYAYRLESYDDWHFCEVGMHQATFENIPPGKYKLHLKASDSYGRWISLPYTIEVSVLPHWYETWWAFLLYLLLIVGLLYMVFRWYQNHVKTQNRLQMMRVFTNITHELLTPLAVISASVDELRMQSPQHDKVYATMQNNISRLVRLLRQILEVRKSQAGQLKLKVSPGNLADFVNVECANFELMAKSRGQHINTDIHEVEGWFDPDKLDKIIYNLLSNALKYNKQSGTDPQGGSYWYQRIVHYSLYNKGSIVSNNKTINYTMDKKNMYWPIPNSSITSNNKGQLHQNFGYDGYDENVPMWDNWQDAVADEDKTE